MRAILMAAASLLATPLAMAQTRPVVVELFTSQGCSSCPPADAFLAELARTRADVLPLAFHVTYWDSLGWRDPFGLAAATARQRAYAATLQLDAIYTPQMVVDGAADVVGSDRASALAAIRRAAAAPVDVPVAVTRGPDGLTIAMGPGAGEAAVLLVGYDPQHRTQVGRGENQGRTLLEANIVRDVAEIGRWHGAAVTLHAPVPQGERAVVLVQASDGHILGAARLAAN